MKNTAFFKIYFLFFVRTLIPVLHQKAKRGTPHQAKQAVHCIHAIFNNKEVQLAQIFEVAYLSKLDFNKCNDQILSWTYCSCFYPLCELTSSVQSSVFYIIFSLCHVV